MTRGRSAAIAGTAAIALTLSATALGDTEYGSRITIANSFPAFHGKVTSPHDLCERDRKVILYGEQPGNDDVLGRTRTDRRGRWKIELEPTSGAFYAKVRRGGSASLGIVCRKDVAKPVIID